MKKPIANPSKGDLTMKRIPQSAAVQTVEAEFVRSGRWIKRYTDGFCNGARNYELTCPLCHFSYLDNHRGWIVPEYFNYCPNCGKKLANADESEAIQALKASAVRQHIAGKEA